MRTGIATLPLHNGKAPRWLFERMVKLSGAIIELMVIELGEAEVLARIADPFWFQAFGCVLGFDWHSSGLTTTTCGAIKEAMRIREKELGIYVSGGKGKTSRKTPEEIESRSDIIGDEKAKELIYTSRMVAKIDSSAIQDGFQLYHHTFIFTKSGAWCVIQQGMSEEKGLARRYHWLYTPELVFTVEPHKAICSELFRDNVLNLVARDSVPAQKVITELSCENPQKVLREIEKIQHLNLPARHTMRANEDINLKRLESVLVKTYWYRPRSFEELLSTEGVGPKTLRALALVSELVYNVAPSWKDPARFSFAHGGKDGIPYPVDRTTYDRTIEIIERAVKSAKMGDSFEKQTLRRINELFVPPQ